MARNFHESTDAGRVEMPSDRSTGIVFAVVAVIVAVLFRAHPTVWQVALAVAAALAVISYLAPGLLRPLNIVWFKFGLLLHRVMNPVIMLVIFLIAFVPFGWLLRWRSDPLRSRRGTGASYWVEVDSARRQRSSMTNQF